MAEVLGLDRLHDIVLPQVPPLWPPGEGFWVALVLLALVLVSGWRWSRQRWRRNAYRLAGLELLAQASTVYQVSVVLKRVALSAWPRSQVASLQGRDWTAFLNATCRRCRFAEDDLGEPDLPAGQPLLRKARRWIRGHAVPAAGPGGGP